MASSLLLSELQLIAYAMITLHERYSSESSIRAILRCRWFSYLFHLLLVVEITLEKVEENPDDLLLVCCRRYGSELLFSESRGVTIVIELVLSPGSRPFLGFRGAPPLEQMRAVLPKTCQLGDRPVSSSVELQASIWYDCNTT